MKGEQDTMGSGALPSPCSWFRSARSEMRTSGKALKTSPSFLAKSDYYHVVWAVFTLLPGLLGPGASVGGR